jgi:hypothetical protein
MIEHIIYINLEHRIDRKEQIIKTLSEHFPKEIIHRIPGVLNIKNPQLGCAQAHINALEHAITNDWKHVLIMEDDMLFNDFEKNYKKLQELMSSPYDAIVLGGIYVEHNPETSKLNKCSSTGAYLVNQNYYHTLIANFKDGISGLIKETIKLQTRNFWWNLNKGSIDKRNSYIIDLYWQRLHQKDNWFIIPLCYSKENYSDTLKRVENWEPYFLK